MSIDFTVSVDDTHKMTHKSLYFPKDKFFLEQAHSQGLQGMQRTTLNLPKGPLSVTKYAKRATFSHKVCQKGGFVGVKGGEIQNVHFVGLGVPYILKIDPGYGPDYRCTIKIVIVLCISKTKILNILDNNLPFKLVLSIF